MKPLQPIIASTDFSTPGNQAIARARVIAKATSASLALVHVIRQGVMDTLRLLVKTGEAAMEQRLVDEARHRLEELASQPPAGTMPSLYIEEGLPLQAIITRADALDAGLVVIGSRGEDYLSRLLLGTTAESLLRLSSRSSLIVKAEPAGTYRKVLVPVDFSSWSIRSLQTALQVAPGAEIILLHAFEAPFEAELRFAGVKEETITRHIIEALDDARRQLREFADGISEARSARLELKVVHGDASYVVLDQIREQGCELVVMGKHGKGVIEELLLGSVTKHVLGESPVDVLVTC